MKILVIIGKTLALPFACVAVIAGAFYRMVSGGYLRGYRWSL